MAEVEALPHPWGGVLVPPMAGVPYNQAGFLLVAWEVAWEVAWAPPAPPLVVVLDQAPAGMEMPAVA